MTFDREQTLTLVRNALHDTACGERCEPTAMELQTRQAERVLPVIVRAVTDEIRALHRPINTRVYTEQDCRDRMCEDHDDLLSGANYCPSYLLQTCAECRLYGDEDEDDEPYPCPTVRLCDEIDVAAGVER